MTEGAHLTGHGEKEVRGRRYCLLTKLMTQEQKEVDRDHQNEKMKRMGIRERLTLRWCPKWTLKRALLGQRKRFGHNDGCEEGNCTRQGHISYDSKDCPAAL